jgi:hypothetical protein
MRQVILSIAFSFNSITHYQVWWYIPIIPVFRTMRQEDLQVEGNLGYVVNSRSARLCGKNISQKIIN